LFLKILKITLPRVKVEALGKGFFKKIKKILCRGPVKIFFKKIVDAKLICKHKGLIPNSNVKACQPI